MKYSQEELTQLEAQLGRLNPTHQLIYSQPNSTLSPIPASYINMATAVNMNNVVGSGTGATNAFGFPRDGNAYFTELLRTNPQMFSEQNVRRINVNREAPRIDAQWIQYNPSHQAFSGESLVHHHWMQSNVAVAIPTSVHQAWYRAFHPYR